MMESGAVTKKYAVVAMKSGAAPMAMKSDAVAMSSGAAVVVVATCQQMVQ